MMGLALEIGALIIVHEILRQLETSIHFSFKSMLFDGFLSLNLVDAFFVFSRYLSLHLQVVAHLHLIFY